MKKLILGFLFLFCSFCQTVDAATFNLQGVNSRAQGVFSALDTLSISGFPTDWQWDSIVVQFNSTTLEPLNIKTQTNGVLKTYSGWTAQYSIPRPTGQSQMVVFERSGGATAFTATWWAVSSGTTSPTPVPPPNPFPSASTVFPKFNQDTSITTASSNVVLTGRPSWKHNVLIFSIAPVGAGELSGTVQLGESFVSLSGYYKEIEIDPGYGSSIPLAISFSSQKNVRIKWWASNRLPKEAPINKVQTSSNGKLFSKYDFSENSVGLDDLNLEFRQTDFTDGLAPTYVRCDVAPVEVDIDSGYQALTTWKIHGNLRSGAIVTIAIPVPIELRGLGADEMDSIFEIRHYDSTIGEWQSAHIDSIRNGYAYLQTNSFSWWKAVKRITKKVVIGAGNVIVEGTKIIGAVKDGIADTYHFVTGLSCKYLIGPVVNTVVAAPLSFIRSAVEGNSNSDVVTRKQGDLGQFFPANASPSIRQTTAWINGRNSINNLLFAPAIGRKKLVIILETMSEEQKFETARDNANLLLANQIQVQLQMPGRFSRSGQTVKDDDGVTYQLKDLLPYTFAWAEITQRVTSTLKGCMAVGNVPELLYQTVAKPGKMILEMTRSSGGGTTACKELFGYADVVADFSPIGAANCGSSAIHLLDLISSENWGKKYDKAYLGAVDYLTALNALFWLDQELKNQQFANMSVFVAEFASYHIFIRDILQGNNIPIKGEAALGFWELLAGNSSSTRLKKLSGFLNDRLGSDGGYAEGTGYLEYINETLFPLYNIAYREGWISLSDIPANYIKSGEWLLNIRMSNGQVAVVDDGTNRVPFLHGYAELASSNPDTRYINQGRDPGSPLEFLCLPSRAPFNSLPMPSPDKARIVDGVGIVGGTGLDGNQWTMSMVSESGKMLQLGNGHDQQDNGTISWTGGGTAYIIDPGYGGYNLRKATARYFHHNTVQVRDLVGNLVKPNGAVQFSDALSAVSHLENGVNPWTSWGNLLYDLGWMAAAIFDFQVDPTEITAGGGGSNITKVVNDLPAFPQLRGLVANQYFDYVGGVAQSCIDMWNVDPALKCNDFTGAPHSWVSGDEWQTCSPSSCSSTGCLTYSCTSNLKNRRSIFYLDGQFVMIDQLNHFYGEELFNFANQAAMDRVQVISNATVGNRIVSPTSVPLSYVQNGEPPLLSLLQGRYPGYVNQSHGYNSLITTFNTSGNAIGSTLCPYPFASVGYACGQMVGRDGGSWNVFANTYGPEFHAGTYTLQFTDPELGVITSTAQILIRYFKSSSRVTRFFAHDEYADGRVTIQGQTFSTLGGLEIRQDGSVWQGNNGSLNRVGTVIRN